MLAKLMAIKAELWRRMHQPIDEVLPASQNKGSIAQSAQAT